jgi:ATP-dependent Clp protease, protease subunit
MKVTYQSNVPAKTEDIAKFVEFPHVVYVNKFDEESAKNFYVEFTKASSSQQPVIPIVIDSYGGHIDALMHMIDICRSSKKTVATIVMGKAMSCGAVLATCGWHGYRFASPLSRLMIHDASTGSFGKCEDIKVDAAEISRLNDSLYSIMAENCQKPDRYFWDIVQNKGRADWFMTAKEAHGHDIINHIRIPEIKITLNVNYQFE